MNHIKTKDIPFNERYIHLALDDHVNPNQMTANLQKLYGYLDSVLPGNSFGRYGNASRAILKKARQIAGNRGRIISKKQVLSLVRFYDYGGRIIQSFPESDRHYSIKIPYSSGYIFQAIFSIFEEYKTNNTISIPNEISACYGKIRRDVFYLSQCQQYEYKFKNNLLNNRPELYELRENLLNDLCSVECALGGKF